MSIYQEMQTGTFNRPDYFMHTKPDFGFYQLMPRNIPNLDKRLGDFKFHISVNPGDVPQAWNIVAEELMGANVTGVAKVVKPDTALSHANPDSIQAGKMITVYTEKGVPTTYYRNLIQKLEDRLHEAKIRPGPHSNSDYIIPGGRYSSYRLDRGPNGEYVASADMQHIPREKRHNPWDLPDPYKNFALNLPENGKQLTPKFILSSQPSPEDWTQHLEYDPEPVTISAVFRQLGDYLFDLGENIQQGLDQLFNHYDHDTGIEHIHIHSPKSAKILAEHEDRASPAPLLKKWKEINIDAINRDLGAEIVMNAAYNRERGTIALHVPSSYSRDGLATFGLTKENIRRVDNGDGTSTLTFKKDDVQSSMSHNRKPPELSYKFMQ